jgi:hypothetical protein
MTEMYCNYPLAFPLKERRRETGDTSIRMSERGIKYLPYRQNMTEMYFGIALWL